MKKKFSVIATAVACMFGFAACDGDFNLEGLADTDLLGHINITVSNADNHDQAQYYANGDSTAFKSSMCNVNVTTIDDVEYDAGTVIIATKQNLLTAGEDVNITMPLIGINLRDTVAGTYNIDCPVDEIDFFRHIDTANWMSLITTNNPNLGNIFVIAASEEAFYIGYEGKVIIDEFAGIGSLVKGRVQNVKALYVTVDQIEEFADMNAVALARAVANLPEVTFNGEISSRRANLLEVLNALDELGELE